MFFIESLINDLANEQEINPDVQFQNKISQQYDYTRHTLIKNLYMFNYSSKIGFSRNSNTNNSDNIVYFLVEPVTHSLVAIDLFLDFEFSCKNNN